MTSSADNLRINPDRLWESLAAMAEIGPGTRGGNNRQTMTDADRDGRLLFQSWCERAGCTVSVDAVGIFWIVGVDYWRRCVIGWVASVACRIWRCIGWIY